MAELIGRLVPLALGIAASPVSVVAVLVILLTRRARLGSIVFASCWIAGIAAAIVLAMALAEAIPNPPPGFELPFEGLIFGILGVVLVVVALQARGRRLRSAEPSTPPKWVASVDNLSPAGGAVLAVTNAMTSPKNLAIAIAAALLILDGTRKPSEQFVAVAVYVLIGSLTVLVPVLVYLFGGERSEATIGRWKNYVTARAAAIVEITVFILGLVLAARGLAGVLGGPF